MRVVIAGGGTGGHLFPGLAVAGELKARDSSMEIVFAGTEHGIEARVVPREGYPIRFVRAEGIAGVSSAKKCKAAAKLVLSFIDAFRLIRDTRPDLVIGVGGYASGAIVLLAFLKSIPTMVLEQNILPGATNKLLGKVVDTICVTYQESMSSFPRGKTVLAGNPIRTNILKATREDGQKLFSLDPELFTVFVFGGSAGAMSINKATVESLGLLTDLREKIQFLHQTGARDHEYVQEAYRREGFKGTIAPFIYQMGEGYAAADMVVSRAGATTLAEITALGKVSVLVPYPFAAGNHQELNARKLQGIGAAKLILDSDLNGETMARVIREIYSNESLRTEMQKQSRSVGRPEAASRVADFAISLVKHATPGNRAEERMKEVR